MNWLTIKKVPERCFWFALLFSTVYQSYRYPLQMNSAGTSPTYSDTPVAIQLAKFLFVLPACLISARYLLRRRLPQSKWMLVILIGCMSIYPLLKACFAPEQFVAYVDVAFWPVAALTLALSAPAITPGAIDKYFRFVFYYALASNLIEIILFFAVGRLPALAYTGSILVRFGGFLDDPNGFPALLYMLMGWVYYRFSGTGRIIAEGMLLVCVLISESFTALGFLVLVALVFFFQHMVRRPKPIWIIVLGAGALALGVQSRESLGVIVSSLSEAKLGSVNDHLGQLSINSLATPQDWLLGLQSGSYQESWWVDSIVNFGLPWAFLCLGIVIVLSISALKALRRARTTDEKAVLSGITMLCFFFLLGNANIPFFKTFPINFLFFLFSMLVFFGKLEGFGQTNPVHPSVNVNRRRLSALRYLRLGAGLTR